MKLEDQVISLELAKRLKELGVKQESHFSWYVEEEALTVTHEIDGDGEIVAAFTVAELGEILPNMLYEKYVLDQIKMTDGGYGLAYRDGSDFEANASADTEADARAKMLIYLLKNKLITL